MNQYYKPQTRTLHAKYTGTFSGDITIFDSDEVTPLYIAKAQGYSAKERVFTSAIDGSPVGTFKFHSLSSKVDVTVRGQAMLITEGSMWKERYSYTSPAGPNCTRTWKSTRGWKDLAVKCEDEQGMVLARFTTSSSWTSMSKVGSLELEGPAAGGGVMMDEMVVTGLAVTLLRLKMIQKAVS